MRDLVDLSHCICIGMNYTQDVHSQFEEYDIVIHLPTNLRIIKLTIDSLFMINEDVNHG
jgi:hypothetical protein